MTHADPMAVAELFLEARPSSIRAARQWAVKHARDCEVAPGMVRVIELLTSELAANALAHGPTEPVRVRAGLAGDRFLVHVVDAGDDLPVVRSTGPEVPGGHGLRLVERLAEAWGVEPHRDGGKTVWFAVRTDGESPLS
ncbi:MULTISPECIES: ATP-binding protein [unclassified Actinotalea]|uniref:ATP-binding protein n=1 Tax=unclassified Actinotalea TaxID=2638618 RepID=UPI0015F3CB13|nr:MULTISPECIES: ATP-binding protein [unclassified Actinotalea]